MEKTAAVMTYAGSGTALYCSWDANTVGMILGVVIGIAGLILTWYYQQREDKRKQAEHERNMRGQP